MIVKLHATYCTLVFGFDLLSVLQIDAASTLEAFVSASGSVLCPNAETYLKHKPVALSTSKKVEI